MPKRKNKLQGYDTLVSTFVLLSNLSEKEVLNRLDKMDKVQVKSTHYYKGQLVLDIEYDAYWASCWFDTSAGIREHTGINLSEVYKDTDPEYFEQFFINNTLTKVTKMIEILFKSEELLIAADSESKVIYGNTTKSSAVEYLNELIPKNGEEAMGIIMLIVLITKSKYVVAKKISVTTTTEVTVKAVKPSVVKTTEDAIRIASKFNLEAEVQRELDNGATPLEALREWDIVQFIRVLSKTINCSLFNQNINFTEMRKNIFVIATILLGIVVVALLYTIATLQSENGKLRNVIRNQSAQISEVDRYYNNLIARGMHADDAIYRALDSNNTKIQVNMK